MLWIMYDLGFPMDAIEVVKDLYQNATTQVRLPQGGNTDQIPVERGTIQGDTLSPFLSSCTWNHSSGGFKWEDVGSAMPA